MASIQERNGSYQIKVSNGRDLNGKQIIETATFTPDPNKTKKQNEKALKKFALDFEETVKAGELLKGDKVTFAKYSELWLAEYAEKQMEKTSAEKNLEYLIHIQIQKVLFEIICIQDCQALKMVFFHRFYVIHVIVRLFYMLVM